MQESDFQSSFSRWKAVNLRKTCCEELKLCKRDRFPLSAIEPHQMANLTNAKHGFVQHKIPDLGNQNPFDSFSLFEVPAYLVITFYKPRKKKIFYMIDIDTLQGTLDDHPEYKSLTEADCQKIAERSAEWI